MAIGSMTATLPNPRIAVFRMTVPNRRAPNTCA